MNDYNYEFTLIYKSETGRLLLLNLIFTNPGTLYKSRIQIPVNFGRFEDCDREYLSQNF